MKNKLVIFLMLNILALTAFAKDQISKTYLGYTLGVTTANEMFRNSPKSEGFTFTEFLNISSTQLVFSGDFIVDGMHMHTMSAEFVNDTLYKLEFKETSLNIDNNALYQKFLKEEKAKFAKFTSLDTSGYVLNIPEDSLNWVHRTDGVTDIWVVVKNNMVKYTVEDKHLQDVHYANMASELNDWYKKQAGPDYDEKNKVDGVAGVRFGEAKQTVIEKFRGKGTLLTNDANSLTYRNATVGGILYDFVIFYFKYDNVKRTYTLVSANLQKSFNTWRYEEGLRMYEDVCGRYRQKYTNERVADTSKEDKLATYGMCSKDYLDGKIPPIVVSFSKSLSQGGDFYYYVTVNYFQGNLEGLYNDEL